VKLTLNESFFKRSIIVASEQSDRLEMTGRNPLRRRRTVEPSKKKKKKKQSSQQQRYYRKGITF